MIFSVRDIDALRLLRWCRYIAPDDLARLFDETTLANLETLKLIHLQKSNGVLALTGKGNEFLDGVLTDLPPVVPPAYKAAEVLRRSRVSKLTLTAYRAGTSVLPRVWRTCKEVRRSFFPRSRGAGA